MGSVRTLSAPAATRPGVADAARVAHSDAFGDLALLGAASAASMRASSASADSSGSHSTWPTAIVDWVALSARFASSRSRAVRTVAPASLVSGSRIANSRSPRLHEMSLRRVTRVRSWATWSTLVDVPVVVVSVPLAIPTTTTESGRPVRLARATSRPSSTS